jgi:hypothetical protein
METPLANYAPGGLPRDPDRLTRAYVLGDVISRLPEFVGDDPDARVALEGFLDSQLNGRLAEGDREGTVGAWSEDNRSAQINFLDGEWDLEIETLQEQAHQIQQARETIDNVVATLTELEELEREDNFNVESVREVLVTARAQLSSGLDAGISIEGVGSLGGSLDSEFEETLRHMNQNTRTESLRTQVHVLRRRVEEQQQQINTAHSEATERSESIRQSRRDTTDAQNHFEVVHRELIDALNAMRE